MSMIDKLSILGVRSFDNTRSETIQFHKPLTLIVGTNGSGKTTIIECLKYVTTGELPPNSKSGAFIHDPKLCNEKEVLAQIRLSFKNTQGTKVVCTRNLQLTVKKNARSFKTLEGTIMILKDGEKHTMSSRVAEMNSVMPSYLGVSKAILDNVIFCHQDESLWPLAAPADLKKRFDEIFEALKYTKAIDNIKVMAKEQKLKLIEHKKDEEYTKINKDKGKKVEKQAERLSVECDELRKEHEDYQDRIKQAARNAEAAWKKAETAGMIVGDLRGKRIEQRTKEESVQSLRQNLNEMSDSDDELARMLEQYEERVAHYQSDLDAQKDQYQSLHGEIQQARHHVSIKERECGSLEAEADRHERQLKTRQQLVKETARSHNIRGFDMDLDDDNVNAFMNRISKMARDQNVAFERARRETQEALQGAQDTLSGIHQKKSAFGSRKDSSRQAIHANDRKIENLQRDAHRIDIDEGGKAALESGVLDVETRLNGAKSDMQGANWDSQALSTEAELRQLDERKEKLDSELVDGTRHAGESARLDFVQKELKDRNHRFETMRGAHESSISSLVGNSWKAETLESEFQQLLAERNARVTDAERQRDGVSREKDQVDYQLSTCKKDLTSKQQMLKKAADSIKAAVGWRPEDYEHEVGQVEKERDNLLSIMESSKGLLSYYDACIKVATGDRRGCRMCLRPFGDNKEVERAVQHIEKEKERVTQDVKEAPGELEQVEKEFQAAKRVSTDVDVWERLKEKEIPAAEKLDKELSLKRQRLIEQLETQDEQVEQLQTSRRDVEAMSRTVQSIGKLVSEIKDFSTQIEELSRKQKAGGLSRGLEQIQTEIKATNEEARTLKSRLNKVTGERERARTRVNNLELELRDTKSKLSTAEYQLKERRSLESQMDELRNTNTEQRETLRSIDSELQALNPQQAQAEARYEDIARRGADKDRELQAEVSKLNNSVNQLKMANQEIEAYLAKDGSGQLERGRKEVDRLQQEVVRLEAEQRQIVGEVKALEEKFRDHADTKRSISDNQRYRRDLRQLQSVRQEIAELETHNAEEDKAQYEAEGSRWQMQRNKLAAEQATVIGSMKSKDEALVQLLADYDTEYKDAARKYKEAHVKAEATKACIEDLGRYGGALDKAIMKYHSIKMEEINRIIEELWRKTYQGTDVDSIMIRSESENGKSNKSYNYRVTMMKQDAEMDMRGRCSAGQKVLASIIIRLALAECFGVNCGLIALDEPTTNLDRDNIRALAESLSEIIKVRRQQKNFQLIVITHDEDFLKYMECSDFADVYYRVSRSDAQKSLIERQSIAEVV